MILVCADAGLVRRLVTNAMCIGYDKFYKRQCGGGSHLMMMLAQVLAHHVQSVHSGCPHGPDLALRSVQATGREFALDPAHVAGSSWPWLHLY